jgi:uncharacterized protein YbcI
VAQAYETVQYFLNKQYYLQKLDSVYSDLLKAMEINYELGGITQLEKLNAQAKKQDIILKQRQLEYDLDISINELKSLMQTDTAFVVNYEPLKQFTVNIDTQSHKISDIFFIRNYSIR